MDNNLAFSGAASLEQDSVLDHHLGWERWSLLVEDMKNLCVWAESESKCED